MCLIAREDSIGGLFRTSSIAKRIDLTTIPRSIWAEYRDGLPVALTLSG